MSQWSEVIQYVDQEGWRLFAPITGTRKVHSLSSAMFSRFFSPLFDDAPVPPPTDMLVVPCSALDVGARDKVDTTGLVVDCALDPHKLESSLSMLIELNFPRAGARLAIRNGVYEFHIPRTFNSQTPSNSFTAAQFDEPYRSPARPDIQSLANCSESQPLCCEVPELGMYFRSEACPSSTAQFVNSNKPMLHVHVSVFDDLTLIGVTASEVMSDAFGMGTLLQSWSRLLAGEDVEKIEGMKYDMAPLEAFQGEPALEIVYAAMDISSLRSTPPLCSNRHRTI
ncbi:hypothetical protein B0H16DRAFT_228833 [Mycena metata]|uniref:Uncharacterized protein n=1 Tax=Mycena metata TaxID=1033252 RepID=A0AAD7MT04_9AGAR|nr:hypothetical protein B0H16DRAFT_228833 [Mycena metata]